MGRADRLRMTPLSAFAWAACLLIITAAACSSSGGDAAPDVTTIPSQTTAGEGGAFALDLDPFVSDREGGTLTYSAVAPGGSFTGSTYNNTFDTMGTYPVSFTVSDGAKQSSGSFNVEVQRANFAVVRMDGRSLSLLDTDTEKFLNVSATPHIETFKAGMPRGALVFERQIGSDFDLYAYTPASRELEALGAESAKLERFVASTTDGKVVFTSGTASDLDLFIWNSVTGFTRTISAVDGEQDRNAMITNAGLVFYERGASGQADIYYYDPATDESTLVSDNSRGEALQGTLGDGGVVFSRIGDGGETDLYYFKVGVGVVLIGADREATFGTANKSFNGGASNGDVVFTVETATNAIWLWDQSSGQTTELSSGTSSETHTFHGVTSDDRVVYSATDTVGNDLFVAPISTKTAVAIANGGNNTETFKALVTKAGVSYVVFERDTGTQSIQVYNTTGATTDAITQSSAVEYVDTLANGDLVYRRTDGTEIFHYETTAGTDTSAGTGAGITYGGRGKDDGDFVYSAVVSAQTDLFLWDLSGTTAVTVSDDSDADVFMGTTQAGDVLFARTASGNSTADIWIYDVTADDETRLTTADGDGNLHDHAVLGTYRADNS